jgi:ubiquinone/menaquinone biosynthesis C-methylase UbiE
MDLLTALDPRSNYSTPTLQLLVTAWVVAALVEREERIARADGDVSEDDYDKRSLYSLLYALYRSMGTVQSELGERYEFTFNTWGYAWPAAWGECPTPASDPQRFGKNAYRGLYEFDVVKEYVREREGRVHVVEMGCGTGAGAHHVCKDVLPSCTYEAFDMQEAAIQTCRRKFTPELGGRLVATRADCTAMPIRDESADFVAVCETHVTEYPGRVSDEDEKFFDAVRRTLKPGGFLVWGNAIPTSTWQPCFDHLESIGLSVVESRDVTEEAIRARDEDAPRVNAYVEQCLERFAAFRIPWLGEKRRQLAEIALKNFARNPATRLYDNMVDGTDAYRVTVVQKA